MADRCTNLNERALFADETADYRIPEEPDAGDAVTFRFRTAKDDADRVFLIEEISGGAPDGFLEIGMTRGESDSLFDYYQCERRISDMPMRYHFRVERDGRDYYYNRLGLAGECRREGAFRITPGFHTPEWAKGAVMYQIFVDRFCNGDPSNDVNSREYVYIGQPVLQVTNWDKTPSNLDVGCFYGGDLQGVWDKLDYLQDLGVEVIYFNPLFVSPSNHKYDTQDYDHIDPHYGVIVRDGGGFVPEGAVSNEQAERYITRVADPENLEASDRFFARFMEEVHRRGMRVIMDGVFNHCGSFNKWLDHEHFYARRGGSAPGAYISKDSPYHTFFKFEKEDGWPDNDSYESWWGNHTLPKLNYEDSPKLYDYILRIARKWVSPPYNVDGWRLDVAADLGHSIEYNHTFWRAFRAAVKQVNPEVLILAEHYGESGSWLNGDEWDTIMNYDAFMEPITWFLTGMEKHSDKYDETLYGDGEAFFRSMQICQNQMQTQSLMTAMNQLSNHDHSRFLTRTNQTVGRIGTLGAEKASEHVNVAVMREAVLMLMTWPGAPTLYYGDEAGVCGWTDPDSRRTYPWDHPDFELIEYHRYLIRHHRSRKSLRRGSLKELYAGKHQLAYGRMSGDEKSVIVINNRPEATWMEIPVWELGIADDEPICQLILTYASGYNVGRETHHAKDGVLTLYMPARSGVLLATGDDM